MATALQLGVDTMKCWPTHFELPFQSVKQGFAVDHIERRWDVQADESDDRATVNMVQDVIDDANWLEPFQSSVRIVMLTEICNSSAKTPVEVSNDAERASRLSWR